MDNKIILIYFDPTQKDYYDLVLKLINEKTTFGTKTGTKIEDSIKYSFIEIFRKQPGLVYGTAMKWNSKSDLGGFLEYLETEFEESAESWLEENSIQKCLEYIKTYINKSFSTPHLDHSEIKYGPFKECVRDAFAEYFNKYPEKGTAAVAKFYDKIIISAKRLVPDTVDDEALNFGIFLGLKSFYKAAEGCW